MANFHIAIVAMEVIFIIYMGIGTGPAGPVLATPL